MPPIDCTNWLNVPYESWQTDCLWACRSVLPSIFPDFEPSELPGSESEVAASLDGEGKWGRTSGKPQEGDVLYGVRDGHPYVAIIVDAPGRLVFTSNPDRGSHLLPMRALQGVEATYRRRS